MSRDQGSSTTETTQTDFTTIQTWLEEADYILIAAGAGRVDHSISPHFLTSLIGMSAAAGLDYTDYNLFKQMFPAMWAVGFRCMYHFIGYHDRYCPDGKTPWSDELKWGYLADQVIHARFEWPNHAIYQNILQILRTKEESRTFVISTNADGMFVQNGFNPSRVYNPQGDYSYLQCLQRCRSDSYWPSEPILRQIIASTDRATQRCSSEVVPHCPNCHGPVFLNVRGGNWFYEDILEHRPLFSSFIQSTRNSKLVILEIGVGFNTPSVLRWPMEKLTFSNPSTRLVRINTEHPEVPNEISAQSISLNDDAADAVKRIADLYLGSSVTLSS
jgi:NAD-dependent SIR2 family protein deacetylase